MTFPRLFIEQAEVGYPVFFLTNQEIGEMVRIRIERADIREGNLYIKIRLMALLDDNGNFVPQDKDASQKGTWLNGFNSNTICVPPHKLAPEDYQGLVSYAERIAKLEEENNCAFRDIRGESRLYFTAEDTGMFQFQLEERQNPQTGEVVYGMVRCAWNDGIRLLGSRTEKVGDVVTITRKPVAIKSLPQPLTAQAVTKVVSAGRVEDDFDI